MRIVIALAAEGNMTRTANAVHMSQPTLSYHIDRIESELGFPLFDRSRKGTIMTEAGVAFVDGIQQIVTDYDLLVEHSRRLHESSTKPTVVLASTADSNAAVARLFPHLKQTLPHYNFKLSYCSNFEVLDDIKAGRVDVCYRTSAGLEKRRELRFTPLTSMEESWLLSEHHPLANRSDISIKDLEGYELYLVPRQSLSPASDDIRKTVSELGLDIAMRDYTDESAMLLAVASGEAVAVTRAEPNTLLPRGIKRVPMASRSFANIEGLVYRSVDAQKLAAIIEAALVCFGDSSTEDHGTDNSE